MPNGMPNWDEWKGLTDDQREYSLFKVLSDVYQKIGEQHSECAARLPVCQDKMAGIEGRIDTVEQRDTKIKWIATGFGVAGVAGGTGGVLSAKKIWSILGRWFS